MNDISPQDFSSALRGWLVNTASLIGSISALVGISWVLFGGFVDDYLSGREKLIIERLDVIEKSISAVKASIGGAAYIEFNGRGNIPIKQDYQPGQSVTIMYNLRRNLPCRTTVQVRFMNGRTMQVDSSLTYEIPATQARVLPDFSNFPVQVRLPGDIPPGEWAYAPLLLPEDCNNQRPIEPPVSDFFTVTKGALRDRL